MTITRATNGIPNGSGFIPKEDLRKHIQAILDNSDREIDRYAKGGNDLNAAMGLGHKIALIKIAETFNIVVEA